MHVAQTETPTMDATVFFEPGERPPLKKGQDQQATKVAVRSTGSSASVSSPSPRLLPTDALEMAMYAFGDLLTAEAWMNADQQRLCCSPAQACRSPDGLEEVLRLLYAIANGTEP